MTRPLTTHADLLQLIADQVPESAQLEYKREFPPPGNGGAVDLLRSLTALANTHGGTVVYGMAAKNGMPTDLVPISPDVQDTLLQRLDNLCRDGVQPRLQHTRARFVPVPGGGICVVDVPRSLQRPHRVLANAQFYGRQSASVVQFDVAQLRTAFTAGEALTERIRRFRAERLLAISAGDMPLPMLPSKCRVVLHLLPLAAFEGGNTAIDFTGQHDAAMQCLPLSGSHTRSRINLDGQVLFELIPSGKGAEYAQLYRDGRMEVVRTVLRQQFDRTTTKEWHSELDEKLILEALVRYGKAMQHMDVPAPAVIMLSFLGMRECDFYLNSRFSFSRGPGFDRDELILPEVMLDDWAQLRDLHGASALMQPTLDQLWNAYGVSRSENYEPDGRWVGQSRRSPA